MLLLRTAVLSTLALAAQCQTSLSVKAAVEQALRSHPLLAVGTDRIAASSGLLRQAGLRPNPRLFFQTENWRGSGVSGFSAAQDVDTFAYVSQIIETAGKRGRRLDVAAADLRRSELERELLAKQIASRVKTAYWQAAGAQKFYELLVQNQENFQQIIEYHEIRVREGAMAEADLLKVRLEGERLAVAANTASLEAERARIRLFREMGQTQFPAVQFRDSLELEEPVPTADVATALEQRTEIKIARQALEQARANLRLQQAGAKPNVDVLFGYKRTTGFHTVLGGVQVDLPFSNRNQGNISSAVAELRAQESQLAAEEALVRAEVLSAQKEVEMRRRQITGLLRDSLQRASESSRIAQAAYREGGSDLLGLLDTERVRIDLQALYTRTLADFWQSVVALETALGAAE